MPKHSPPAKHRDSKSTEVVRQKHDTELASGDMQNELVETPMDQAGTAVPTPPLPLPAVSRPAAQITETTGTVVQGTVINRQSYVNSNGEPTRIPRWILESDEDPDVLSHALEDPAIKSLLKFSRSRRAFLWPFVKAIFNVLLWSMALVAIYVLYLMAWKGMGIDDFRHLAHRLMNR